MSDTDTHASGLEETLAGEPGHRRGTGRSLALAPGVTVERYVLESRLGAGAMGVVWAAHDPELDRRLAIKFLAAAGSAAERVARLRREAQAMARLSHPNVVTVHDVGRWGKSVFVAMEYVDGGTLGDWMETRRPLEDVLAVFASAARGLAAAHKAGIVHRDFKPDNVLMGTDGRVCVADFGLARGGDDEHPESGPTGRAEELRPSAADSGSVGTTDSGMSARLTQTGRFLGTPAYMAPEQHLGLRVDARSDQFAFCISLWEALFGSRPYRGDSVLAIALQVCEGGPPTVPTSPTIPAWLRAVLVRGLSTDPDDRFPSMDALLEQLELDRTKRRRAIWLGLGGVAAVAAAVATTVIVTATPEVEGPPLCAATSEGIDEVWTADRRQAIASQFESSGLAYAPATLKSVEASLDGYADEFAAVKLEACEKTHLRREQTPQRFEEQSRCLDRTLREFDGFVGQLERADDVLIEHAVNSAESLSGPRRCLDMASGVEPPPTGQRADVEELFLQIADAKALRLGQRIQEGDEVLDRVIPKADGLGYAPVRLAAWMERGLLASQGNDAKAARVAFSKSIALAVELDDDLSFGLAAGKMIWATGAETPDELSSEMWRDLALAVEELPRRTRIEYTSNHASTLSRLGKHDQAIAQQREALDAFDEIRGEYPVQYTYSLTMLGGMLIRAGRFEEGKARVEEGIEQLEALLGPDHPKVTPMRLNLATALFMLDDIEAAVELQRQVVDDYDRLFGAETPKAADARYNLGLYLGRLGRPEDGIAQLERARAIYKAGGHTVWVAQTDLDIAQLRVGTDGPEVALESIREVLTTLERELGASNPITLGAAAAALDTMLVAQDPEDTVRFAREFLPKFHEGLGERSRETAQFELGMVLALLRSGEPPESVRARFEHSVEVLAETDVLERAPYSGIALLIESRLLAPTDPEGARAKAKAALKAYAGPSFALEREGISAYLESID